MAAINEENFSQLIEDIGMDAVKEIMPPFFDELLQQSREFHVAFEQLHYAEAGEVAHKIKSASRSYGAQDLADTFADFEASLRQNQVPEINAVPWQAQVEDLIQALAQRLSLAVPDTSV